MADPPRRPTMKDVAALAGVSIKTVSRVTNGEPLVSAEVTARVNSAIEQLKYHPDQRAGSLRRSDGKTGAIGLVVSSVANPFAAAVHRAVENAAVERGFGVFASSIDDDPEREQPTVEALLRRRVDGLILTTIRKSQGYLLNEQAFGTPLVFIDREPLGVDADSVVSDHAEGAALATRHLIAHGHRKIAFLGDRAMIQSASERRRGFLEELGRHGIPTTECPVVMEVHDEAASSALVLDLLSRADPPTAIFGGQNLVTVGAIRALREIGAHHRVALIGFDDLPLADLLEPGVSVVAQDENAIGSIAAERLFERIAGDTSPPRPRIVPTRLIPRGSGEIPA